MAEKNIVNKNSEILFLYDAKMCNPNGDMDDENKPRMDKETDINLVSDVRLKRYVRDYLKIFEGKPIYVDDDALDGKTKLKQMKKDGVKEDDLIDIRLFGAVLPKENKKKSDKKESEKKESEDNTDEERGITGPIQFTWGYSLNKTEMLESKTITSKWSGQGGIGKDFRIKYSLLAFSGFVNSKTAQSNKEKGLTIEDLHLFEKALLRSIPLMSTRSKYGQYPRFYLRVELKDDKKSLKDLREYVFIKKRENISSIDEVELGLSKLVDYLKESKDLVGKIFWWADDKLSTINGKLEDVGLPMEELNVWKD